MTTEDKRDMVRALAYLFESLASADNKQEIAAALAQLLVEYLGSIDRKADRALNQTGGK